jgi:hypothetical protein
MKCYSDGAFAATEESFALLVDAPCCAQDDNFEKESLCDLKN